ncbi:MAG: hypothetical protein R2729_09545 [Bryobacteraceae bacterium]
MNTVRSVFRNLARRPGELLVRRWNWKAAVSSSMVRALLFFAVNLTAGLAAAAGAMAAEFAYRFVSAGFYGALTQSFRKVEPRWHGAAAATALLVTMSHSLELLIHWARGTPNLAASIAASCAFTSFSTLFNLHAMRLGVLVTDDDGYGFWKDLRMLPGVIASMLPRGCSLRNRAKRTRSDPGRSAGFWSVGAAPERPSRS